MLVVLVTACVALSYAAAGLPGHLNMISGLAASRRHPGILYAIQDNAGDGNVYMLDATDGSVKGNVYILSEATGTGSTLGQLPSSGWTSGSQTAVKTVLTLPITTANKGPLAADISPDGKQLLIKTLDHVYVWSMPDMDVKKALSHPGRDIQGDKPENRGEAIAWSADGHGYYTEGQGSNEKLHFFNFP